MRQTLISWNVNGLRAVCKKGFEEIFKSFDADYVCLQETKLSAGQLELSFPGYTSFWNFAEKKGYSGTTVFTRKDVVRLPDGIGADRHNHEGRAVTLDCGAFYLVNVYVPNSQAELARLDYRLDWEASFLGYIKSLDALKPVIICGDLNVAHNDIDVNNPDKNRGFAGFSDQERNCFNRLLDAGFKDSFRLLHPDKANAYSWWSYMFKARERNNGWRIDYFLVSDRIADKILEAEILSDIMGSDHCPVKLVIDI